MTSIALGDIIEIKKGKKPSSIHEHPLDQTKPCILIDQVRGAAPSSFTSDDKGVEAHPEDLCMVWDGANAGTVGFGVSGYLGSTVARLRIKNRDDWDPEFIGRLLQGKFADLNDAAKGKGATIPHVDKRQLEHLLIPRYPIEQQKRIAAILDQADQLRRKRQLALDRLNQLGRAIFTEMFGASDNVRFMPLGEIADLKRGPFGGALKKEIFVPNGYKVYEQGNAIKRSCNVGSYFIDHEKYREMQGFAVAPNDLIVSCSGTIGRTYLIPEDAPPGIINQALLRVRVNKRLISPRYLEVALASSEMQDFLTGLSRGTGLQNFPPMSEVRSIPVPMPSVTDHGKFLQRLEVIEAAHQKARRAEEAHEALFASLQHRAFRGEL